MNCAELDAAGITTPELRSAYLRCRRVNAEHGRTFFLATRLLSPARRPAVHALYGFARMADDLVDLTAPQRTPGESVERFEHLATSLLDAFASGTDHDPALAAVVDTARRFEIPEELFADFLRSMRMDFTITDYQDRDELNVYVRGSAEAIGLQLLPILGTVASREAAEPYAAALGNAFQLTNFLRDVAEDLGRGRVYLPADELAVFGVDRARLDWCRSRRRIDRNVRNALAYQIAFTRAIYRNAEAGISMLAPDSQACVATAFELYSRILDRIEAQDYNVFAGRTAVGPGTRALVAGVAFVRVVRSRRSRRGSRRCSQ